MDLDFYFNEWAFLAKTDPALFEQRRREYIGAFIRHSGAHRPQLETLQSKIDQQRELAATPEGAVAAISELMCASLAELGGEMNKLLVDLKQLKSNMLVRMIEQAQGEAPQRLAA
jgi:hypothetical protein